MDIGAVSILGGGAYLVVLEKGAHRIWLYERKPTGKLRLIEKYGGYGPGYGKFNNPNGVAIVPAGDGPGGYLIYVADSGNRRVVCLRYRADVGIR